MTGISPHALSVLCLPHRVVARFLQAKGPSGPAKGWEKRKENDDFTEQNIPEELVMLWRKKKDQFKGTPHQRYEKFMEWVEENPEQNMYVQMEYAEKKMKEHARQEKKETLCRKRCPSCYRDEEEDAPFLAAASLACAFSSVVGCGRPCTRAYNASVAMPRPAPGHTTAPNSRTTFRKTLSSCSARNGFR